MSLSEDGQLISQIRQGNIQALKALYEKYKVKVYRTALAITRDREAAEDILQDCFLRVYTYIDRLDGSLPLSPWLHRVTVNLSYNWVNKRRRWLQPLEDVIDQLIAGPRTLPEFALEKGELQLVIQKAVASLSFEHRVVIVLFYLNNFSLNEIAYVLDCPVGTVKSRLHYARRNLRRKLETDKQLVPEVAYEFS
ncbi:MAG: sigma-70 family RNA polymerase sigma factor [Anaerolineales bacterium]|nr:sigma-70 family RNA polymerase sigma factor [Anaerolineales bacterium]